MLSNKVLISIKFKSNKIDKFLANCVFPDR